MTKTVTCPCGSSEFHILFQPNVAACASCGRVTGATTNFVAALEQRGKHVDDLNTL